MKSPYFSVRILINVVAAEAATRGQAHCSIALDKADIRSLGVQKAAMVLPSGLGFELVSQVSAFPNKLPLQGHSNKTRPMTRHNISIVPGSEV